ncbi:flagellar hook assembly protein FlgD [Acidicapsa ligni]|uniref:flagellar hook assembly protein FlgD n=1 Tax=Acidicapsa ligni TaxID=542300 RepID=UPI0021E0EDE9|nr:flagellar hook capping FlgD N-terminal domain-containing protein [Acidicapsa ligni]
MSNIWGGLDTQAGTNPFQTNGKAPTPGGGTAAKFQSMLQSSSHASGTKGGTAQLGLSPSARSASSSASGKVAQPMDASDSSSSDTSNTTISANDFLTLLVTEMQNQDPTAQTDPNEYIDQLVQINSLEQLISINQNLTDVLGTATAPTGSVSGKGIDNAGGSAAPAETRSVSLKTGVAGPHAASAESAVRTSRASSGSSGPGKARTHGNLSVPGDAPSARTVTRSLDGRPRGVGHGHGIRDIPTH